MTSASFPIHIVPPSEPEPHASDAHASASSPPTYRTVMQDPHTEPLAIPQGSGALHTDPSFLVLTTPTSGLEVEEEDDLMAVQEETVVEAEDFATEEARGKDKDMRELSTNDFPPSSMPDTGEGPQQAQGDRYEDTDVADWHPLQFSHSNSGEANQTQDITVVLEDGDVVDSNGRVLFPESGKATPATPPRRASHLRLNIKPPSPQPWDLIEPPTTNGHKRPDYYSTIGSQKFNTLQSNPTSRPLIPKSSYYFGPPPSDSAYGTHPIGQIGLHHPREILRVERDYTGGELIQFAPIYPLELEGRITPTQFLESINAINELLISAHSLIYSFFDNMLAVFSLQLSRLVVTSHYEKEMQRLRYLFDDLNTGLYNPVGLNILWPRKVAFLYLEIEYY